MKSKKLNVFEKILAYMLGLAIFFGPYVLGILFMAYAGKKAMIITGILAIYLLLREVLVCSE